MKIHNKKMSERTPAEREAYRAYVRNRYRKKHGIPLDAPVVRRRTPLELRTPEKDLLTTNGH